MRTCSIVGCDGKHYARGLCNKHYMRWWTRGGDPSATQIAERGSGTIRNGYRQHTVGRARKFEHVIIAERALGRPLPPLAQVHHVDFDRLNNTNENLVICPDDAYHKLLHRRTRALNNCGHADWLLCGYCKRYSPPSDMYIHGASKAEHRSCRSAYTKQWRENAKR